MQLKWNAKNFLSFPLVNFLLQLKSRVYCLNCFDELDKNSENVARIVECVVQSVFLYKIRLRFYSWWPLNMRLSWLTPLTGCRRWHVLVYYVRCQHPEPGHWIRCHGGELKAGLTPRPQLSRSKNSIFWIVQEVCHRVTLQNFTQIYHFFLLLGISGFKIAVQ